MTNSLFLLVATTLVAIPVSVLLGTATAIRRDGWLDRLGLSISVVVTALPEFVIGLVLVLLCSTTVFHLLPAVALIPPGSSPLRYPVQMVLPVLTLVLAVVPYSYRQVRASMIEVLESDYVAMARLKGMPKSIVTWRHAFPNSLVPLIQSTALVLTYLLGGIVIVEFLFGYPGLGGLLLDAMMNRDLPVIEGVVLVFATGVVVFNLAADILTVYRSPRLRTASN
jgi:peptide/nickel transport system permease protein